MTDSFRNPLAKAGAALLLLLAGFMGAAHAAGTTAGTPINNSATLNYSVGGTAQAQICSSQGGNSTSTCFPTTFVVDRKVDVLVTTSDVAPGVSAVPSGTTMLTFVVTNTGNSAQDISLSTITSLTGALTVYGGSVTDTFNPSSCQIFNYTAGPSATAITGFTGLAVDTPQTLKVSCALPAVNAASAALANSDISVVSLLATVTGVTQSSGNAAGTVDTVFADGAGSDDSARNADYSARSAFRIQTAVVSVAKTFTTICDPAGGDALGAYTPKSIPGAYVQYTITISNASGAPASAILSTTADALVAQLALDPALITGANVAGAPNCVAATAVGQTASGTALTNGFRVQAGGTGNARPSLATARYLNTAANTSGGNPSINWVNVLAAETGYLAGELKAGESVQLVFNTKIN